MNKIKDILTKILTVEIEIAVILWLMYIIKLIVIKLI